MGCVVGGIMDVAFKYVESNPLATESEYPYIGKDGSCKSNTSGPGRVSSYNDVPAGNVSQMKAFLDKGPVAVAIEADRYAFQGYTGGVITGSSCGQ